MKKVIMFIIGFAIALGAIFGMRFYENMSITNEKQWHMVSNSEMSITIPKTMKEGKGMDSSMGTVAVALYNNSKTAVRVDKLPYSGNEALKSVDIESYINSLKIGGNKLTAKKINDGYYATYTEQVTQSNGEKKNCYSIEAFFSGDDALYDVKVSCFVEDQAEYEPSMLKWLESFRIK